MLYEDALKAIRSNNNNSGQRTYDEVMRDINPESLRYNQAKNYSTNQEILDKNAEVAKQRENFWSGVLKFPGEAIKSTIIRPAVSLVDIPVRATQEAYRGTKALLQGKGLKGAKEAMQSADAAQGGIPKVNVPYFGDIQSYQSEFANIAPEVIEGKKPLYAAAGAIAEPVLDLGTLLLGGSATKELVKGTVKEGLFKTIFKSALKNTTESTAIGMGYGASLSAKEGATPKEITQSTAQGGLVGLGLGLGLSLGAPLLSKTIERLSLRLGRKLTPEEERAVVVGVNQGEKEDDILTILRNRAEQDLEIQAGGIEKTAIEQPRTFSSTVDEAGKPILKAADGEVIRDVPVSVADDISKAKVGQIVPDKIPEKTQQFLKDRGTALIIDPVTGESKIIDVLAEKSKPKVASPKVKTSNYYVYDLKNKKFVSQPDAKPVSNPLGLDLFIHKNENGRWIVSDGKTGFPFSVVTGGYNTKKEAVIEAVETSKKMIKEGVDINQVIKDKTDLYGMSPKYRKTKKNVVAKAKEKYIKPSYENDIVKARAEQKSIIEEEARYMDSMRKEVGGIETIYKEAPYGGSKQVSRHSNNPQWYRDFYKDHGRAPNKSELLDLAKQELENGRGMLSEQYKSLQDLIKEVQPLIKERIKDIQDEIPVAIPSQKILEGVKEMPIPAETGTKPTPHAQALMEELIDKGLADDNTGVVEYTPGVRKEQSKKMAAFAQNKDELLTALLTSKGIPEDIRLGTLWKYIQKSGDVELQMAYADSKYAKQFAEQASSLSMAAADEGSISLIDDIQKRRKQVYKKTNNVEYKQAESDFVKKNAGEPAKAAKAALKKASTWADLIDSLKCK